MRKKIAIVGSGISGMTSAYHLNKDYDVTIYEAADYIGGHTNTIEVDDPDLGKINIDTGFIVFNDWTYDNFIKMLGDNNVESEESPMSFAVKCQETGLEYNGTNLNTLFAQRINLFKPRFWRMILDILRFNKAALLWLESADQDDATTLGDFLINGAYSNIFIEQYAWPMTSAIWSSSRQGTMNFPFRFFVQFFKLSNCLSSCPIFNCLSSCPILCPTFPFFVQLFITESLSNFLSNFSFHITDIFQIVQLFVVQFSIVCPVFQFFVQFSGSEQSASQIFSP